MLLHAPRGADGGEGGGEVFEGPCECSACVIDYEGDELYPSPLFSDGLDEGGYLSVFFSFSMAQPKSLQKPTSTRMIVRGF